MTAAKIVIPTIIQRRTLRSWRVVTTRTSNKKTKSTGNSNATPKAAIISVTRVRYLSAVMNGWIEEPPTPSRNSSAFSTVNQATTPPSDEQHARSR